jgi:hypothetical protein
MHLRSNGSITTLQAGDIVAYHFDAQRPRLSVERGGEALAIDQSLPLPVVGNRQAARQQFLALMSVVSLVTGLRADVADESPDFAQPYRCTFSA